jgi:hypothetical protein
MVHTWLRVQTHHVLSGLLSCTDRDIKRLIPQCLCTRSHPTQQRQSDRGAMALATTAFGPIAVLQHYLPTPSLPPPPPPPPSCVRHQLLPRRLRCSLMITVRTHALQKTPSTCTTGPHRIPACVTGTGREAPLPSLPSPASQLPFQPPSMLHNACANTHSHTTLQYVQKTRCNGCNRRCCLIQSWASSPRFRCCSSCSSAR